MKELTKALNMEAEGVARAVGVTVRTVRAWLAGERKPAERNRVKLARLVLAAQREHSSADGRWSATRDAALSAARLALMSADEIKIHERRREQMREQFAKPVEAVASSTFEAGREKRHAVWASYRGQGALFAA